MIGPVKSPSGHLKTTLVMCGQLQVSMNMYLSTTTTFCFVNFSAPENSTKLVLYSKFTYGSQFSEKKRFRNLFIGFRDIKQTNILTFFLNTLYHSDA